LPFSDYINGFPLVEAGKTNQLIRLTVSFCMLNEKSPYRQQNC